MYCVSPAAGRNTGPVHTKHFWSYRGLTVRQPTVVRRYEMGNGKTTLAVVRHGSSLTAVRFLVVLP